MRHRKISVVEERISFVVGSTEVFVKNGYFGDEILHSSRRMSPILNWKTTLDSACAIPYHWTQLNPVCHWVPPVSLFKSKNSVHHCSDWQKWSPSSTWLDEMFASRSLSTYYLIRLTAIKKDIHVRRDNTIRFRSNEGFSDSPVCRSIERWYMWVCVCVFSS